MTIKKIAPIKSAFNKITKVTFNVADVAEDGIKFTIPTTDEYVVILVQNTAGSAGSISVKAPVKGSYASASEDLTMQLEANEVASIRIESAKYAENDGSVTLVPTATTMKVAVIY